MRKVDFKVSPSIGVGVDEEDARVRNPLNVAAFYRIVPKISSQTHVKDVDPPNKKWDESTKKVVLTCDFGKWKPNESKVRVSYLSRKKVLRLEFESRAPRISLKDARLTIMGRPMHPTENQVAFEGILKKIGSAYRIVSVARMHKDTVGIIMEGSMLSGLQGLMIFNAEMKVTQGQNSKEWRLIGQLELDGLVIGERLLRKEKRGSSGRIPGPKAKVEMSSKLKPGKISFETRTLTEAEKSGISEYEDGTLEQDWGSLEII